MTSGKSWISTVLKGFTPSTTLAWSEWMRGRDAGAESEDLLVRRVPLPYPPHGGLRRKCRPYFWSIWGYNPCRMTCGLTSPYSASDKVKSLLIVDVTV